MRYGFLMISNGVTIEINIRTSEKYALDTVLVVLSEPNQNRIYLATDQGVGSSNLLAHV